MKKSLVELLQVGPKVDVVGPDVSLNAWGNVPFAQLSVVLVHLRYLALLHQTHHWIAKGDPFYGDHLLYMRLYEKVVSEIDSVAEKAVGMGNEENVCLLTQVGEVHKVAQANDAGDEVPTPEGLAKKSLAAEQAFIKVVEAMCESMKTQGIETPGIENMLQGICDVHEGHVYLLKRRCEQSTSGF